MPMAKIFKPIRWQSAAAHEGKESPSQQPLGLPPATIAHRENRMGAQPVTNTPPSGPLPRPLTPQEEGWLALLELVFEETGWPDA